MKVWVYVEGPSDCNALNALWVRWRENLKNAGWGIQIKPIGNSGKSNKSKFFDKIGWRAIEKLEADSRNLVVGLPDFYPNQPYANGPNKHDTWQELCDVQSRIVRRVLKQEGFDESFMERFYPSALKHDLEMLLLAAREQLRSHLETRDQLVNRWRYPVEEQNQNQPPKRVVEELYLKYKKRAYRDTTDAPAVLRSVNDLGQILYFNNGQLNCPVFKDMLDWVSGKTGVPAC